MKQDKMDKTRCVLAGITALMLSFGLVLAGCGNPAGSDDSNPPAGPKVVTALDLTGKVTAPVRGATPVTTFTATDQYTGVIVWQTADGVELSGDFAAGTEYKAVLTLTAQDGYTFTGLGENAFTYGGATVSNDANSGTLTISFPATAAEGTDTTVTALDLSGKVTAPVKGAAPVTAFTATDQYTGVIVWQTAAGTAVSGNFAAGTEYKAVLTLTAKTGYTFTGLGANVFTYGGATVSNAANSGTLTISFPATAAEGTDTTVTALDLSGKVTAPVKDAAPVTTFTETDQYTGVIVWKTAEDGEVSGNFAAGTVYKAVLTLTAKTGYTFTGLGADAFTYTGATSVTNTANSGTLTISFPATAANEDILVDSISLFGKVKYPVQGAVPDTTEIDDTQYTGVILWQTAEGAAVSGNFAAESVYKAVLTLTAKTGYTFDENMTIYSPGAKDVTKIDSGTATITITFPATEKAIVSDLDLTGKVTAPVKDAISDTTEINADQYTGTVEWFREGYYTMTSGENFAAGTWYEAIVKLTAKHGYTFTGLGANAFTYTGVSQIFNAIGPNDPLFMKITIRFPETEKAIVSDFDLTDNVTVPVKGSFTGPTFTKAEQYSVTGKWYTVDDTPIAGKFGAETVYKAVVTLTAESRFTFTGVGADVFTHDGATSVTNDKDSGTVTITFPATAEWDPVEALKIDLQNLGDTSADEPGEVVLKAFNIDRDDAEGSVWGKVNAAVTDAQKYVILDLGNCTFTDNKVPGSRSEDKGMTILHNYRYIKGIILPESVTSIDDYAFRECRHLTSITIPAGVTSIGKEAFYACNFTSITLPASLTSIGEKAFYGCDFTSITLPASLTSIGESAFNHCDQLTSITLPASLTSIGYEAFRDCNKLTSVTFEGSNITSFSSDVFKNHDSNDVGYVPHDELKILYNANGAGTYTRTENLNDWIQ
jgi:hypothetical protein